VCERSDVGITVLLTNLHSSYGPAPCAHFPEEVSFHLKFSEYKRFSFLLAFLQVKVSNTAHLPLEKVTRFSKALFLRAVQLVF